MPGATGNTLHNHQMMGSLRMLGAGGFLLILIAIGTNGQLLTEKIPLGKSFFMEISASDLHVDSENLLQQAVERFFIINGNKKLNDVSHLK